MDLKKLDLLREKLLSAKDFSGVFNYFFDHFGENSAFLDLGDPARHPLLEGLLEAIGEELFGKKTPLKSLLLIRIPQAKFIHGGFLMHGKMGNVFYFEEIDTGLAVISMGGQQKFSRFTARPLDTDSLMGKN